MKKKKVELIVVGIDPYPPKKKKFYLLGFDQTHFARGPGLKTSNCYEKPSVIWAINRPN